MKLLGPRVGQWYQDLQTKTAFEVVAWDPKTLLVETQFIDGEVSEYDLDSWKELQPISIEAPEDWRNPYELDGEESHDPDLPFHPEDWSGPLSDIEPEFMIGVEEY